MNFWEARQAALEGKRVKRLIGEDEFSRAYTPLDFQTRPMEPYEVNGHWEIVEEQEPVQFTNYVNLYTKDMYNWTAHATKQLANRAAKGAGRIACIAITVDENGNLISTRNV